MRDLHKPLLCNRALGQSGRQKCVCPAVPICEFHYARAVRINHYDVPICPR